MTKESRLTPRSAQSNPAQSNPAQSDQGAPTGDDLVVIICAYTEERWDDIVEAIASVNNQAVKAGEIVLVVDHNDNLLARARAQFPKGITIVANKHKQGLSGGRNTGVESSSKQIVAFLDDDAVARDGWIEALLSPYEDANVIGVGGAIEPIWLTARPSWWPAEFDWIVGCSYVGLPTKPTPIRNPIGANMSVRREAFDAVGGFSDAIGRIGKRPLGCEETEFYLRVHQHWPQSVVLYEPKSIVGHKVPAARASFEYFRARCFAEGISKAAVSKLIGSQDGLESERAYTIKTLPIGVVRGIGQGFTGKGNGFRRAGAIIGGLAITTAGYIRGRIAKGPERSLVTVPSSTDTP